MSTTPINNEKFSLTRWTPPTNGERFDGVLEAVIVDDALDADAAPSAQYDDGQRGQEAPRATTEPGESSRDSARSESTDAGCKVQIELPGNDRLISDYAVELATVLANSPVFTRHNEVVAIDDSGLKLRVVRPEMLRTLVEFYCAGFDWRWEDNRRKPVYNSMSPDTARALVASPQFHQTLRRVRHVHYCRQPVLRPTGQIELLPTGYDAESEILTLDGELEYPTDTPLESAKTILEELLSEFPFAEPTRDKAVAFASMLGLYAGKLLPSGNLRPCFLVLANGQGAGKSILVSACVSPTLGLVPTTGLPKGGAEMSKLLLTLVRESAQVLFLDNVKGHLDSDKLEAFLSGTVISGRRLGTNDTLTGENTVNVFVTANGLTITPDTRRRCLFIELRMTTDCAEQRSFRRPLHDTVLKELRPAVLGALWALVRHWDSQGRPAASREHPSFPVWAKTIGGIVEAAGLGDCLAPAVVAMEADTQTSDIRRLVAALAAHRHEAPFPKLVEMAAAEGCFEHIVGTIEPGAFDLGFPPKLSASDQSRLGKLLKGYDGQHIGGHRFTITGRGHAKRFAAVPLGTLPDANPQPGGTAQPSRANPPPPRAAMHGQHGQHGLGEWEP